MKTEKGNAITSPEIEAVAKTLGKPFFAGILKEIPCSLQQISLGKCKLQRVFIKEKAENLFLYGRDVFKSSVIKGIKEGLVLVCNQMGEPLGIAKSDGKVLKNLKDLGFYLRSENSC